MAGTTLETIQKSLTGLVEQNKSLAEQNKALADEQKSLKADVKKLAEQPNYGYNRDTVPAEARSAEEGKWGFKSLGEQLHAIADVEISRRSGEMKIDKRLHGGVQKAPTGMSEMVGSEGGFPLAPTFVSSILEITHEEFNLLDQTDKHDITSPSVKVNAVDEKSRANGSRYGGIRGYWANEGDSMTASKPTWRQITLNPHKLFVLYYATEELLADGGQMLSTSVNRYAAKEINFLTTDAILNGTGAGQPQGILNSGAKVKVSALAGQATKTVVSQNVVQMWSQLHVGSRNTAIWLVNQEVEAQLPFMTIGTAGAQLPVYLPPGGLSDKPYGTMMGRPVRAIEQCAGLGTEGDIMLIDPKQYISATRGAVQSSMSIHVAFLTDESVFKFTFRVDGQPWWSAALTPYKGSATQSPFITLAAR